jgi:O-antigen/teichoic acid export membrane protein
MSDIVSTSAAGPAAIRGGLLRAGAFAGGLALGFVAAPLLIRHLGDADFGRYSAVLAVIMIVTGLTEGGINTVAIRELSSRQDPVERDRIMRDLLGLRMVLSAVGVVLAVAFSAAAGYGSTLVLGTFVAGLGMFAVVAQTLVATVLQSQLRFGWAALIELVRQTLVTGLIVVLVVVDGGVLAFLAVSVPAALVALGLTVGLVRGTITLRPAFHPDRWRPLLRETLVVAVAVAVNAIYFRVALVVMSLVATADETGTFAISYRVMEVLVGVPALLTGAAFPIVARAARSDRARFEYATERLFELSVLLGALAALLLGLTAPFLIEVLTGDRHHPATVVLQIQSAALLASFIASAVGYPLLSLGRFREALIANCVPLVLVAVLALALTPAYGARGAAAAAVVADFSLAIAAATLLARKGGPPLPLAVLPVAMFAAACGLGAGTLVGVHPLVEATVAGLVYLAVLGLLRRFPPEVRELVRRGHR